MAFMSRRHGAVPRSWRERSRCLPFATLLGLYALHPDAMNWLAEGMTHCESPRAFLFSFDAMTLIIVAIASAFGARAISRLRRQVAEARQLGQYRLRAAHRRRRHGRRLSSPSTSF